MIKCRTHFEYIHSDETYDSMFSFTSHGKQIPTTLTVNSNIHLRYLGLKIKNCN